MARGAMTELRACVAANRNASVNLLDLRQGVACDFCIGAKGRTHRPRKHAAALSCAVGGGSRRICNNTHPQTESGTGVAKEWVKTMRRPMRVLDEQERLRSPTGESE